MLVHLSLIKILVSSVPDDEMRVYLQLLNDQFCELFPAVSFICWRSWILYRSLCVAIRFPTFLRQGTSTLLWTVAKRCQHSHCCCFISDGFWSFSFNFITRAGALPFINATGHWSHSVRQGAFLVSYVSFVFLLLFTWIYEWQKNRT